MNSWSLPNLAYFFLLLLLTSGTSVAAAGGSDRSGLTKTHYSSESEAHAACLAYAAANGGSVVITSGTPSMEPLIHGQTFAVIQVRAYGSIKKHDVLVYMGRPDASKPDRLEMLHRVVMGDRHGWMMSGDNNRWSESWDRVTPATYVGTVVALFEYPAMAVANAPVVVETAPVMPYEE